MAILKNENEKKDFFDNLAWLRRFKAYYNNFLVVFYCKMILNTLWIVVIWMKLYIYIATNLSNKRESKILYSTGKILPAIWVGYKSHIPAWS